MFLNRFFLSAPPFHRRRSHRLKEERNKSAFISRPAWKMLLQFQLARRSWNERKEFLHRSPPPLVLSPSMGSLLLILLALEGINPGQPDAFNASTVIHQSGEPPGDPLVMASAGNNDQEDRPDFKWRQGGIDVSKHSWESRFFSKYLDKKLNDDEEDGEEDQFQTSPEEAWNIGITSEPPSTTETIASTSKKVRHQGDKPVLKLGIVLPRKIFRRRNYQKVIHRALSSTIHRKLQIIITNLVNYFFFHRQQLYVLRSWSLIDCETQRQNLLVRKSLQTTLNYFLPVALLYKVLSLRERGTEGQMMNW